MDRLGYTAMTAARRTEMSLQIHANNLANASTTGFRADMEQSEASAVEGFGYESRHLTMVSGQGVNMASGSMIQTGRELDVAIQGRGLLVVASGDSEAYTRNGNLQINADMELCVGDRPLLGEGGPITLPEFDSIHIGRNGVISITARGDSRMTEVDQLKLVDIAASELEKNAQGLLVTKDGSTAKASEEVKLVSGFLEGSNVSAIEELVASMSLNRLFESQVKMMKAAEDMSDAGNRVIRGG